jgi:hypothetical protein
MFITIHAAVAIAATQGLASPLLAGAAGFASHLVLDIVPHGDDAAYDYLARRGLSRIKFGLVFGVPDAATWLAGLAWYLSSQHPVRPSVAIAAAVGAALPDVLWGLSTLVQWKLLKKFDRLHEQCHGLLGRGLLPAWAGFSLQAAALAAAALLLLHQ